MYMYDAAVALAIHHDCAADCKGEQAIPLGYLCLLMRVLKITKSVALHF